MATRNPPTGVRQGDVPIAPPPPPPPTKNQATAGVPKKLPPRNQPTAAPSKAPTKNPLTTMAPRPKGNLPTQPPKMPLPKPTVSTATTLAPTIAAPAKLSPLAANKSASGAAKPSTPQLLLRGNSYSQLEAFEEKSNAGFLGKLTARRMAQGDFSKEAVEDEDDDDWGSPKPQVFTDNRDRNRLRNIDNPNAVYADLTVFSAGTIPSIGIVEAEIFTLGEDGDRAGPEQPATHIQLVFEKLGLMIIYRTKVAIDRKYGAAETERYIRRYDVNDSHLLEIWDTGLSGTELGASQLTSLHPEALGGYSGIDKESPFAYALPKMHPAGMPILQFRAMRIIAAAYNGAQKQAIANQSKSKNGITATMLKLMSLLTIAAMLISGPHATYGWNLLASYNAQVMLSDRFGYTSSHIPASNHLAFWASLMPKIGMVNINRTLVASGSRTMAKGRTSAQEREREVTRFLDDQRVRSEEETLGRAEAKKLMTGQAFDLLPSFQQWSGHLKAGGNDQVPGLIPISAMTRRNTYLTAYILSLTQLAPSFATNAIQDALQIFPTIQPFVKTMINARPWKTAKGKEVQLRMQMTDAGLNVPVDDMGPLPSPMSLLVQSGLGVKPIDTQGTFSASALGPLTTVETVYYGPTLKSDSLVDYLAKQMAVPVDEANEVESWQIVKAQNGGSVPAAAGGANKKNGAPVERSDHLAALRQARRGRSPVVEAPAEVPAPSEASAAPSQFVKKLSSKGVPAPPPPPGTKQSNGTVAAAALVKTSGIPPPPPPPPPGTKRPGGTVAAAVVVKALSRNQPTVAQDKMTGSRGSPKIPPPPAVPMPTRVPIAQPLSSPQAQQMTLVEMTRVLQTIQLSRVIHQNMSRLSVSRAMAALLILAK